MFVRAGSISLDHATVAGNSGTLLSGETTRDGGGVYQSGAGGMTAASSLFGGLSDPDFVEYAGNISAVNSLFQSSRGGGLTGTNNLVGVDPLFSASGLQKNGGPARRSPCKPQVRPSARPATRKAS